MKRKVVCIKKHPLLKVHKVYDVGEIWHDDELKAYFVYKDEESGHIGYLDYFVDLIVWERDKKLKDLGL
jgi:hypothetical protein